MSKIVVLAMSSALVGFLAFIYVTMPASHNRGTPPLALADRIAGLHFLRRPKPALHRPCPLTPDSQSGWTEPCLDSIPLPAIVQEEDQSQLHRELLDQPAVCPARPAFSGADAQARPGTAWSDCTAASLRPSAHSRRSRKNDPAAQFPPLPETDCPFFLWRQFKVQDDDTLLISLKLCPNPSVSGGSGGAIVGQVIPEGWEVSSASPAVNARDQRKREIKWLFTTVPPGSEQLLEIVLQPLTTGETTVLSDNATFYRCRRPSGQTAQFSCLDLE